MKHASLFIVIVALFCACGSPKPAAPAAPAPPKPAVPVEAPPLAPTSPESVPTETEPEGEPDIPNSALTVVILDLDGAPIPEVAAIVTEAANAFDNPIVRGSITGADGKSDLLIPRDRETYVRGWDPTLNYFANSFLTIAQGDAPLPADSSLVMAPASQLTAQFYAPDGVPLPADTQVQIMFSHPSQGPWWPARATTNADGRALFDKVPAGKFHLSVYTEGSGEAEVTEALLLPRQTVDLGIVQLK
jgi:hypothetical protein